MLRMSFLEHLEELRKRLILALAGLGVAFVLSLTFSERLWNIVQEPAAVALANAWLQRNHSRDDITDGEFLHHLGEAADAHIAVSCVSVASVSGLVFCRAGFV